jgi:hypothetical protein
MYFLLLHAQYAAAKILNRPCRGGPQITSQSSAAHRIGNQNLTALVHTFQNTCSLTYTNKVVYEHPD